MLTLSASAFVVVDVSVFPVSKFAEISTDRERRFESWRRNTAEKFMIPHFFGTAADRKLHVLFNTLSHTQVMFDY